MPGPGEKPTPPRAPAPHLSTFPLPAASSGVGKRRRIRPREAELKVYFDFAQDNLRLSWAPRRSAVPGAGPERRWGLGDAGEGGMGGGAAGVGATGPAASAG
jgi:hypothetical protein